MQGDAVHHDPDRVTPTRVAAGAGGERRGGRQLHPCNARSPSEKRVGQRNETFKAHTLFPLKVVC